MRLFKCGDDIFMYLKRRRWSNVGHEKGNRISRFARVKKLIWLYATRTFFPLSAHHIISYVSFRLVLTRSDLSRVAFTSDESHRAERTRDEIDEKGEKREDYPCDLNHLWFLYLILMTRKIAAMVMPTLAAEVSTA